MKTIILLVSFLVAGGGTAFWLAGALPGTGHEKASQTPKSTAPSSTRVIRAVGYVEPVSELRRLTFKIDGVIETCPARLGQTVEAGETLATLRNLDEKAAVVVAEKELLVAQAERDKLLSGVHPKHVEAAQRRIAKLQERIRYAQQQHDRQLGLFERKVGTKEALDQVRTDLQQAKEELLGAEADLHELETHVRPEDRHLSNARVELAEAYLTVAKERFRNTILTAPLRGTVLEIVKREGEAVRAFDPQPVLVFADVTDLRVRAEVDERYVRLVQVGQDAVICGRSLGDRRIAGKVVSIKTVMGGKTVFTREAAERKDLDVLQVFIHPTDPFIFPVGLQVDIEIASSPDRSRTS